MEGLWVRLFRISWLFVLLQQQQQIQINFEQKIRNLRVQLRNFLRSSRVFHLTALLAAPH